MPRDLSIQRFRNFGIIAHVDAGKTTLSERVLLYTGKIHRTGEVHQGTTVLDSSPQSRKRGITIAAAATTVYWERTSQRYRLNLIDTPGHVDFAVEVERALRVLDGAIVVLDGSNGVEPQTEAVWRQADRHAVPRIVFINKMDRETADFRASVESLRERLGVTPLPVQLPLGQGKSLRGVIDLLGRRAIVFHSLSQGRTFDVVDVPLELRAQVEQARALLVEACSEHDDRMLARYIEGQSAAVTAEELEAALRRLTLSRKGVPVLCGSAYANCGVQPLLDAVVAYLPAPSDLPPVRGASPRTGELQERRPLDEAPLCALAFKVEHARHLGNVTFLRVYSGTLRSGDAVLNATRGERGRVGRLLLVHADDYSELPEAQAGVIAAAVGLDGFRSGDTLCDEGAPIVLGSLEVPEPVVELAVEPRLKAQHEAFATGLRKLALEDPSLHVAIDEETGQTLLRGMGELHLDITLDRLHTRYGVEARTGKPAVSYRESVASTGRADYRHVRQTGGPGQYAHVVLEVSPLPRGGGFVFVNEVSGGSVPHEYVPAVEKGARGAAARGVQAGHPVVDVKVRLLDGSTHPKDSSALAFELAGSLAFQQAARSAGVFLLEPILAVEVTTPTAFVGTVIGDLGARRGRVQQLHAEGQLQRVEALVPLEAMFGYADALRSRTEGRASAHLRFSHYAPAP